MEEKIIHIGFPKTGTTYLQKNVYPYLEGIKYYDYKTSDSLFYDIIFLDDLDYDADKNKETFETYLSGNSVLFSFESLAGAPFIYKGLNRSLIPGRLKGIGFNKVIITLRNQVDTIDSMYRQYVVQGGVMRFRDFIDLEEKWLLSIRPFNLGYLQYDKLINQYYDVFGKENVLVLLQEDLRRKKQTVIASMESFTGDTSFQEPRRDQSKNESLSNLSIKLLRICNHFIFTSQKPNNLLSNKISTYYVRRVFAVILDPYFLRFFSSKKAFMSEQQKKYLKAFYKPSNERLHALTGIAFEPNEQPNASPL